MKKKILVVDDNRFTQEMLRAVLSAQYNVEIFDGGQACLSALVHELPDLILLDVDMPGLNGFETCREIRKVYLGPILFVSTLDQIEDQISAFEAGGDDYVTKPFDKRILCHKIRRSIETHSKLGELALEKQTMSKMASDLLDAASERAILLSFMQQHIDCQHPEQVFRGLLETLSAMEVLAIVDVRLAGYETRLSVGGDILPAEHGMLSNTTDQYGLFLYKNRLLINGYMASILIRNLPVDRDSAARITHNMQAILSAFESLLQTVVARREFAKTTEDLQVAALNANESTLALQSNYKQQYANTQMLLHGLIAKVERAYFSMGLTECQENQISELLREETDAVMALFQSGAEALDRQFSEIFTEIMDALAPPKKDIGDVWL